MTELAIQARDVARRYGTVQALTGVDLDVERSEIFAVLGPNGAGKTTLIEILEGLRRRDTGTVNVLGEDPSDGRRSWRAKIGAVLQLGTETDELTVQEMVASYAGYYPHPLSVDELLGALDLTAQRDRRVGVLSGGQRRRLDLGLGLIGNPELLFLDEPTTGLDPEVRRRIWDHIQSLADKGTTIVLTTHYMEEAEQLADRVAVLVAGEVVATGHPSQLGGPHTAQITFRRNGPLRNAPLPQGIPASSVTDTGSLISITSDNPATTVTQLVAWATALGGELADLTIERCGLEQVYLDLLTSLNQPEESTP
jgi:ABC-2 type transport system ATP-binding protein